MLESAFYGRAIPHNAWFFTRMILIKSRRDAPRYESLPKSNQELIARKDCSRITKDGARDTTMEVKGFARKRGYKIIYVLFVVSSIEIYSLVPSLSFSDIYPPYLLACFPTVGSALQAQRNDS